MKRIIIIVVLFFFYFFSFGQSDTLFKMQQKGFLFLSNYNYLYDCDGCEVRSLGFHDFFFPSDCINTKCFLDSNMNFIFKNGIRVDFINNRKSLKSKADIYSCIDSSKCYLYDRFYVLPVIVDYKIFEDYEPFVCRQNYFELQVVGGSKLRFEYLHKAIKPIRIIPTVITGKSK